jgi:hypothetical protein
MLQATATHLPTSINLEFRFSTNPEEIAYVREVLSEFCPKIDLKWSIIESEKANGI